MLPTLQWTDSGVRFLDQTRLPVEEVYVTATNYAEVAEAIRTMVVRGAPAIGVSAAMGVALGIRQSPAEDIASLERDLAEICQVIGATRPTAVNLFWAIERMQRRFAELKNQPNSSVANIQHGMVQEALATYAEDVDSCRRIGAHGASLMPDNGSVLTHCNAGALCASEYGTALGVIRAAVERGKRIHVYADETRPFLQGARLTAWELLKDNIPTTVLCDNMAASLMRQGKIQAVIVGADRIAANGDVANKIGTYGVAVLAREHDIPFYVAAPWSTIDLATPTGDDIVIEQRSSRELTHFNEKQITPDGAGIHNPAFDVTPAKYVTAIVTERGILRAPYSDSLLARETLSTV